MFPMGAIAWQLLQALPYFLLNPFFWLILFFVNYQYKRMARMEIHMFGVKRTSIRKLTLISAIWGLVGGLIGSFLIVFVGVSISDAGFGYVWLVAVMLAVVSPRFMCFAYAGGLVSLSSLLFGYPQVSVPGLMALVAILHLIESALIWLNGHLAAVPIYLKDKNKNIVGGFSLQKFWPIPLIALFATAILRPEDMAGMISMPDWWPLIRPTLDLLPNQEIIYQMIPVVAALGYGDMAVTCSPKERSRRTALYLAAFSVILLLLSIAASRFYPLSFLAALFAPLGHEFVAWQGMKREMEGDPLYVNGPDGVRVLDVLEKSPAASFGFQRGDLILSANNIQVNSRMDLQNIFYSANGYLWFDIEDNGNNKQEYQGWYREFELKRFGLLLAPDGNETVFMEIQTTPPWKLLWDKLIGKLLPGRIERGDES